ncbi:hypothetical protein EZS27_042978, partial [termite gut metagenome]
MKKYLNKRYIAVIIVVIAVAGVFFG